MLAVIILAPLAGAAILGLFGRRMSERAIGLVACSTVAASAVLSFYAFFGHRHELEAGGRIYEYLFTWISVGDFRADFSLLLDSLSAIYILFITFVAFWIHVFATGYMHGDAGYWRFFAYLNLFMFSMLTLILADNFLLMFVGWEGVGLCSYLLIGYYFRRGYASDAAKKAFVVNRVGDFGFAIGLMLLFWWSRSVFYFDDPSRGIHGAMNWAMAQATDPLSLSAIFAGGMTTIAVLLFVGATGKSAQIPLFVWLPDAMAGPTPVSALIHAATMVTAGVYMVSRASFIYVHAPTAMMIVAIVGAATALFAATIGLAQWDIKKVLAYSTISQLGYMFLACGVGAFAAGIFHVFTHAFFKALLFLGSGSVIVGMHHEQDMRRMGGLKKFMPITFWTMLFGWLAISGVPMLSGFFSKDEILYRSFTAAAMPEPWPKVLWLIGAITALLTAIYMTRLMMLTFWGSLRSQEAGAQEGHAAHHPGAHHGDESAQAVTPPGVGPDEHEHHAGPPRESPRSMVIPLVVLAIGAIFAGWLGVPEGLSGGRIPNYFERLLEPSLAHSTGPHAAAEAGPPHAAPPAHAGAVAEGAAPTAGAEDHGKEWALTIISSVIALVGIGIGWAFFNRKPLWQPPRLLEGKYYVDEAYDAAVVQPIKVGSTSVLWKVIDVGIIDGAVNAAGFLASRLGDALRYLQSGLARSYVAVVLFGALVLIGYFVIRWG
ncbi:MAG TPA: NADH-quinone oxidoreductase subunit L [Blastocatellia bacterium]|jgi:NADH-quinone oxidoreductase subunit L|nr:NADH-quinone oxidoreductase subunit L [Blastocatellia bacterium]